ncbi:MAG: hypothetical protein GEV11_15750 [Streptosporangiales bacterium]|nr:hypothetical protein [Streptosporangiales bacterium]
MNPRDPRRKDPPMAYNGKHRRFNPFEDGVSRREMVVGSSLVVAGVALGTAGAMGTQTGQAASRNAAATSAAGGSRGREEQRKTAEAAPRAAESERASRGESRQPLREQRKKEEPEPRPEKSRPARRAKKASAVPIILSTGEWKARKPERKATVRSGPPKFIVIHHTTTDNVDDFSLSRAKWLARAIQNAHLKQGWGDTGQQFTISRGGHILEGRAGSLDAVRAGDMVVGTHVAGLNDFAVGIECEGMYSNVLPPRELRASLVRMCAWLCREYDLNPHKVIVPHRKFNPTDCCGRKFARTIPQLRRAVAKAL